MPLIVLGFTWNIFKSLLIIQNLLNSCNLPSPEVLQHLHLNFTQNNLYRKWKDQIATPLPLATELSNSLGTTMKEKYFNKFCHKTQQIFHIYSKQEIVARKTVLCNSQDQFEIGLTNFGQHTHTPTSWPQLHSKQLQSKHYLKSWNMKGTIYKWMVKLVAKNLYLQACISSYLRVNASCPICRKPLNEMTCTPSNLVLKR